MKNLILLLAVVTINITAYSQSSLIPLGGDTYHILDRLEILSGRSDNSLHSSMQPYARDAIMDIASEMDIGFILSKQDQYNLNYLHIDNAEWSDKGIKSKRPFLKYLYRNPADLYDVDEKDFLFKISPVFYLQYGREMIDSLGLVDEHKFINTRGIELRGMVDKKVGFYLFVGENQAMYPTYMQQKIADEEAVPGEGYYKTFKTTGVDYFTARGYLTLDLSKHIDIQFGHDKNFIGNGYRSLFLSDNSNNYLFLKVNTKIWKLHYQNIFAELVGQYNRGGDQLLPKKYAVFHHLSLDVCKNFNIGLFESVIFSRDNGFEFNYLNPIIFYRSIEQEVGSPDNAMIGLDMQYNFLKHFSLYGQLLLDEFNFGQFRDSTGWWGNKFGTQVGFKYIDVAGISNLDIQGEFNMVLPYTYTHKLQDGMTSNHTHYNQALAHPLGSGFYETIGIIRYQPVPKINIIAKVITSIYGEDTPGSNWGGNIFLDNTTREQDYFNTIAQGVYTSMISGDLTVSYQLKHNMYFDLRYIFRNLNSEIDTDDSQTHFGSIAFRLNIPQKRFDY